MKRGRLWNIACSADALFCFGKGVTDMKWLIVIALAFTAFVFYCCLCAGAEADRQMEEIWQDGKAEKGASSE